MAKKSAKDELLARLDADIARVNDIADYVGSDGSEALAARVQADLAKFTGMRDYVSAAVPVATVSEKPKRAARGKGKSKPGLPATGEAAQS